MPITRTPAEFPPLEPKRLEIYSDTVILPRGLYDDWLDAPAERSIEFRRQFPADRLITTSELRPWV